VTDNVNQSKGDQDPAEWMPPLSGVHCRYIGEWAAVKTRWGLTVDTAEKSALTSYANSCSNVTITVVTVLGGGGGSTPTPTASSCTGSNGTNVTVPDAAAAVTSAITISGGCRAASASATIEVHIVHSYRGDLVVTLLAPDGSTYALKSSSTSDSAANVDATYTRNLSSETAAGTWRLQVQDVYAEDSGYIDSWTLTV